MPSTRAKNTTPALLITLIAAVLAVGIAYRIHAHHTGLPVTIAAGWGCFIGYQWSINRLYTARTRTRTRRR
ncbi:hypothetical protein [Streptantibioticus silvisoli]|uniref:Uncharacterized protein n=1 Tax=Streptantibioticus silvisoli TaxID=2705255 RepID=A0ABT6W4S5_9ACTN|nr:hypothetical protein [Streptantibioticus silvisoli]MDI5965759.1 hypothetical protein [Streptantibioticus silvisoli]